MKERENTGCNFLGTKMTLIITQNTHAINE